MSIISSKISDLKFYRVQPTGREELAVCSAHADKLKEKFNTELQFLFSNSAFKQKVCSALSLQGNEDLILDFFIDKGQIQVAALDKNSKAALTPKHVIHLTETELLQAQHQLLTKVDTLWNKCQTKCGNKPNPHPSPSKNSLPDQVDKVTFDTELPSENVPDLDFGNPLTENEKSSAEVKKYFYLLNLAESIEKAPTIDCPSALLSQFGQLEETEKREVFNHLYLLHGSPQPSDARYGEYAFYNDQDLVATNLERAQAIRHLALSQAKSSLFDSSSPLNEIYKKSLNALPPEIKHSLSEHFHALKDTFQGNEPRKLALAIETYLKTVADRAKEFLALERRRKTAIEQLAVIKEMKKAEKNPFE